MDAMQRIAGRLRPELEEVNRIIARSLETPHEVMNGIVTRYLQVKGKQIRPLLVLLSAGMFGKVSDPVLEAGAALEMLHNASLIHDDIVDETALRRGVETINARMGNHIAVLVGDFFVANALQAGIRSGDLRVISALSALGKELSLGEIDQLSFARDHALDEEAYFGMIRQKTASLFMHCVRMGAELGGASEEMTARLTRYAELLGLAFQIRDDIFDYFDAGEVGKPTGNDLREGKVTLPLLYAVRTAPKTQKEEMGGLLLRGELTDHDIASLIAFAKEQGGIEYAYSKMEEMQREAASILAAFDDTQARRDFADIFDYIITRRK